jgi:mono/diheme cytochrome c family protein
MSYRSKSPALLLLVLLAPPALAQDAKTQFEKTIRPLFERKCFQCHSSKADELKGNLKLETVEQILKGGDSGPAVVAGDKESFLLRAIRYEVEDYQMPPSGRLEDKDIALIEKWVKALGSEAKLTR